MKKSFKGFFLRKSTDDWLGGVVILDLDDLKNIWIFADAKIVSCNHLEKFDHSPRIPVCYLLRSCDVAIIHSETMVPSYLRC